MIAKKLPFENAPTRPILAHSQNTDVDYPPASFRSRSIAMFIDSTVSQVFTSLMVSALQFVDPELVSQEDIGIYFGVTLLVAFSSMFFVVCVPMMFTGQSPGKMLMGIKVISLKQDGELTTGQIMKREMVAKGISAMMLGIGYLMALRGDKRAWHDKNCLTRVVSIR